VLRLATDPRLGVTLADLRERHTILDVLDLHDTLDWLDACQAAADDAAATRRT
jgi:hypothetical protein